MFFCRCQHLNLPIKEDATPVGASNKHFGFVGSSPCFLRIYSTHALKTFIKKDLPTPPPPEIKKKSNMMLHSNVFVKKNKH